MTTMPAASMTMNQLINAATAELLHTCDGPVDNFIIIARGVDLAASGKYTSTVVSNAIYNALSPK